MTRSLAALAAPLLLIGAAAVSQDRPAMPTTPPGAAQLSRVESGTYAPDAAHTLVGWRVNHFGFNDYFGQFGNITGTLVLDRARPAQSRLDIRIPVNSLTAASAPLVTHMLSADFFDAANHAEARFVSRSIRVRGQRATITGDLTLRGQTRPVTLDARFVGAGTNPFNSKPTVGFHATARINRSDWGMSYGAPLVSDAVDLTISAAFEKQ